MATNTTSKTANYGLSQYATGDPAKFLTNYNSDMKAIDDALKAIADEAAGAVPNTRKIAGLAMGADITLAQLIKAGLAAGTNGQANDSAKLGGVDAASFPQALNILPWTPIIYGLTSVGSPTYTTQTGYYYQVGKKVHLAAKLAISSKGGMAGALAIGGLPVLGNGNIVGQFIPLTNVSGCSLSAGHISGIEISGSGNFGYLRYEISSGTEFLDAANINDNFSIVALSGDYLI